MHLHDSPLSSFQAYQPRRSRRSLLSQQSSSTALLHENHYLIIRDSKKKYHDNETTTINPWTTSIYAAISTPPRCGVYSWSYIQLPLYSVPLLNHMGLVTLFQLETSLSYHQQNTNTTFTFFARSQTSPVTSLCSGTSIVTLVSFIFSGSFQALITVPR